MAEVTKREMIDGVCKVCDFYKENDEQLECGAFKIIKILVEEGKLRMEDIYFARERLGSQR
ncbi:hypothetical protein Asulf_02007 [Archaeoglobus sulfaticallidus PM70-1]|uniref:Uncharacterized protein n=1 Tax=Archaeoglobus sulfaticallidus PM70-1 TaxID=387631 RepID=N0BI56_9EURY|nr:hypothetical protein [Archaeoglobus sulfaticallidus]AGK61972.1 hypothetical protein Asulf_02007 [Archaeoglobus sulfaticallidus PM70-1]